MPTKNKEELLVAATEKIKKYFGNETASLYSDFYNKKEPTEIILSVEELLTEYLGEAKGKEISEDLKKIIND